MVFSMKDDSYVVDEAFFLSTGYMHVTEQTMAYGFEQPPLIRAWAALPLLGLNLKPASEFYDTTLTQETGVNISTEVRNQWDFAEDFLFDQTQSPERILFWSRLMMVILTLFTGFLVFKWSSLSWGSRAGLLSLVLFSLSPLILAHGRIVNMDVAAALGIFASTYYFVKFLQKPGLKQTLTFTLVFAFSQLIKASLLLLVPYFIILFFVWLIINSTKTKTKIKFFIAQIKCYFPKLLLGLLLTLFIIGFVYSIGMLHYPKDQQAADIEAVLKYQRPELYKKIPWFSKLVMAPGLRNLTQYTFGVIWQYTRSSEFNYFYGKGSSTSFPFYFPVGYLVKEPLAFHILTLLGLYFIIRRIKSRGISLLKSNFFILAAFLWIGFYWLMLVIFSPINSGIRYLIPTLPFIYFLIAGGISWWLNQNQKGFPFRYAIVGGLLAWQLISVFTVYPSFLAYFNELIGGPEHGYQYFAEIDVEWGQDAKRLAKWAEANGVEQIAVPYLFDVKWEETMERTQYSVYSQSYQYYLGSRYQYLPPNTPTKGWVAIPVRLLQWGTARPAHDNGWSSNSYQWLKSYEPVTKIGYSVFVYNIN